MLEKIKVLHDEISKISAASIDELELLRIKYISKKGLVNQLFADFKDIAADQKK
jgi:phenylalanyl-tRNA synthetase alpha chain